MHNLTQEQIENAQWNAHKMGNLTQDEIEHTYLTASETFNESDYVFFSLLVQYMMGYLRNPPLIENEKIDDTRQVFFKQIKQRLDEKELTRQGNRSSKGTVWGGQLLGWTTQEEVDALEKSIKTDY